MSEVSNQSRTTEEVLPEKLAAACLRIQKAMQSRFRAYLRPGERLRVQIEREKDFVYAQMIVEMPDGSYHLDIEAAVIVQDQEFEVTQVLVPEERLELAFEFLRGQLHDYFRQNRVNRFHADWRIYPFEGTKIRFRGRLTQPGLERLADELLGEPSDD